MYEIYSIAMKCKGNFLNVTLLGALESYFEKFEWKTIILNIGFNWYKNRDMDQKLCSEKNIFFRVLIKGSTNYNQR